MKNKNGFVDGLVFMVLFFVIVLAAIIAGLMFQEFRDSSNLEDDPFVTRVFVPVQNLFDNMQNLLILLGVGLGIALIVSVFLLPTGPVFKFAAVIMILILTLLAGSLANVFETIADADTPIGNYTRGNYGAIDTLISDNYPKFILVFLVFSFILLLGKRQFSQNEV